jgi:hypothetical protein
LVAAGVKVYIASMVAALTAATLILEADIQPFDLKISIDVSNSHNVSRMKMVTSSVSLSCSA